MANRPLKPCNKTGCNQLTREKYCSQHQDLNNIYDKSRGTAAQRGYNHRWRKARAYYLSKNPICVRCNGIANVVDHITPHKGDYSLFWDRDNWQPLCTPCHNRKTATEDGGFGR